MNKEYCKVYHEVLVKLNINANEYFIALYLENKPIDKEFKVCKAGKLFNITKRSVYDNLKKLKAKNLINKKLEVTQIWKDTIEKSECEYYTTYWFNIAKKYNLTPAEYFIMYKAYKIKNRNGCKFNCKEDSKDLCILPTNLSRHLTKLCATNLLRLKSGRTQRIYEMKANIIKDFEEKENPLGLDTNSIIKNETDNGDIKVIPIDDYDDDW